MVCLSLESAGKGDMEAPKTASSSSNETITGSSEKRVGKRQPKGTFEYIVSFSLLYPERIREIWLFLSVLVDK